MSEIERNLSLSDRRRHPPSAKSALSQCRRRASQNGQHSSLGVCGSPANRPLILAAWADGLAIGFCAFPFVRIRGSRCRAYGALGGAAPLVLNNRRSVAVCKGNGVSRVTVSVADFIYNEMNSAVCRVLLGQQGTKQGTAKRRLSHVCSKHSVNLWRYHRLQDQR